MNGTLKIDENLILLIQSKAFNKLPHTHTHTQRADCHWNKHSVCIFIGPIIQSFSSLLSWPSLRWTSFQLAFVFCSGKYWSKLFTRIACWMEMYARWLPPMWWSPMGPQLTPIHQHLHSWLHSIHYSSTCFLIRKDFDMFARGKNEIVLETTKTTLSRSFIVMVNSDRAKTVKSRETTTNKPIWMDIKVCGK